MNPETSFWKLLNEKAIVIPIIQRDYAQGRTIQKAPAIRKRFLNKLVSSLENDGEVLNLDFVYGYNKVQGSSKVVGFTPLDGQQRLTTLFLLHWYVALKENKLESVREVLKQFTYETRQSSRQFCEALVAWKPLFIETPLHKQIMNQPWFFTAWKHDPTIAGMLIMLEDIEQKCKGVTKEIWPLLISEQAAVKFHVLQMDELGLPDELYIKMNARGKELTDFEYFKSRFSEFLPSEMVNVFQQKVDTIWSDLFWNIYRDRDVEDIAKEVDSAFLRFFDFITIVLANVGDIQTADNEDRLEVGEKVYKEKFENIDVLFKAIDAFYNIAAYKKDCFSSQFYLEEQNFAEEKTRLFFGNVDTNLFVKCADKYDAKGNAFSIGEQLFLFAMIVHLLDHTEEFSYRIRKTRNLIASSAFRLRRENLPQLLKSTAQLIRTNTVPENSGFDAAQLEQEKQKEQFVADNPSVKTLLFRVEDHHLLQGNLAIFDLDLHFSERVQVFMETFKEVNPNYKSVIGALLTKGDYSRRYSQWHLLGNDKHQIWRDIFTTGTGGNGFPNTKKCLLGFLDYRLNNPSLTLENIEADFIDSCEQPNSKKEWIYYFIKYSEFRHNEDGYYFWDNENKPYECIMLKRSQRNGYHWSPFLYMLNEEYSGDTKLDNYNAPLYFKHVSVKIENKNTGYKLEATDDDSIMFLEQLKTQGYLNEDYLCEIKQNEGLDIEDRIQKGKDLIEAAIEILNTKKTEVVA